MMRQSVSPAKYRFLVAALPVALGLLFTHHAQAANILTPPAIYPPSTWQGKSVAVLRVLRRVDSHVEEMTIPVGQEARYKTLHLQVEQCVDRPKTLSPDSAARLVISDEANANFHFEGWILRSNPALSTYTNPLYGVSVVKCDGNLTVPIPGPLPTPAAPDPSEVKKMDDAQQAAPQEAGPQVSSQINSGSSGQGEPLQLSPAESGASSPSAPTPTDRRDSSDPMQLAPQ